MRLYLPQKTALVNVPFSSIPIFLIMSVSHWFLHQPNEIPTTLLNIIDDLLILASLSWRQEFDWSAINSSAGIFIDITTVIKGVVPKWTGSGEVKVLSQGTQLFLQLIMYHINNDKTMFKFLKWWDELVCQQYLCINSILAILNSWKHFTLFWHFMSQSHFHTKFA